MKRTGFLTIMLLSSMLNAQNINNDNDHVRLLICKPSELRSYFDFLNALVSQANVELPAFSSNDPDYNTQRFSKNILIGDQLLYQINGTKNHIMNNGSKIETEDITHTIIFTSNEINYYLTSTREAVTRSNQTTQRIFTNIKSNHAADSLNSLHLNDSSNDKRTFSLVELFKRDLIEYLTSETIFNFSNTDASKENECYLFEGTQKNLEAFIETSDEIIHANMGKFNDITNEFLDNISKRISRDDRLRIDYDRIKFEIIINEEKEKLRNARE